MGKDVNWTPETGDDELVKASRYAFLTGISTEPPSPFNLLKVTEFDPVRHGIAYTFITNDIESVWGVRWLSIDLIDTVTKLRVGYSLGSSLPSELLEIAPKDL